MIAEATVKVSITDAVNLADLVIKRFARLAGTVNGKPKNPDCRQYGAGFEITDAVYGASLCIEWDMNDRCFSFAGTTGSGTVQEISINIATGKMRAVHAGLRGSSIGLVSQLVEDDFDNFDWKLESCETSRPDWAVYIAIIDKKFGIGPTSLREETELFADRTLSCYQWRGCSWPHCSSCPESIETPDRFDKMAASAGYPEYL